MLDLSQIVSIEDVCVFIIDKNRPLNLDNLFAGVDSNGQPLVSGNQIIVFDDGDVADLKEERAAFYALLDDDDEDDGIEEDGEDDHEESEIDFEDDGLEEEDGKEKDEESNGSDLDEEEGDDKENDTRSSPTKPNVNEDDDDEEEIKYTRKRNRSPTPEKQYILKKNRRLCEKLINEYYTLNYCGTPATSMLFSLSSQIAKESNNFLWMALIGLSSQFLTEKMDMEQYLLLVETYKDNVKRLNNTPVMDREVSHKITAQDADDYNIHFNPYELRLMFYRHWSLYDAMFHSSYVASKLKIWREQGRQRLRNLLAKMGFSIVQSQQKYYDCDLDLRNIMEGRLEDVGIRYGLDNLTFESFVRCFGFKAVLGACDAFYSLSALAEVNPNLATMLKFETNGKNGFYLAFDALDKYLSPEMLFGIDLAQTIQRAIVKTGIQIIEERLVKTLKTFRLVVLKDSPDLSLFSHPLTIHKLALFMVEAMKQTGRSYMPLVIAAYDKETDVYLTVGTASGKSVFSDAFKRCADVTKASIKQDRFDCSIVEIDKADIGKFMEHLQIFL